MIRERTPFHSPVVRRFIKFCLVGASSFTILLLVEEIIVTLLSNTSTLAVLFASSVGFATSVFNGFYWNRRWTFRHKAPDVANQFTAFLIVNLVGLALNNFFMFLFYDRLRLFSGVSKSYSLCQMLATVCVTFWNFFANSRWTFAHRR